MALTGAAKLLAPIHCLLLVKPRGKDSVGSVHIGVNSCVNSLKELTFTVHTNIYEKPRLVKTLQICYNLQVFQTAFAAFIYDKTGYPKHRNHSAR